jgi:hypothetical protein
MLAMAMQFAVKHHEKSVTPLRLYSSLTHHHSTRQQTHPACVTTLALWVFLIVRSNVLKRVSSRSDVNLWLLSRGYIGRYLSARKASRQSTTNFDRC